MAKNKIISRRTFIRSSAIAASGLAASGFTSRTSPLVGPFLRNPNIARKAIVLGMDGLDPKLVQRFVAEGKMPT